MSVFYVEIILAGLLLIGIGSLIYIHPDLLWELSLSRRWFLKGGEPTELYYSTRKMGAVCYIVIGIIMIIVSICMYIRGTKGYVIELDGSELKIPCVYSDVVELGYQIDPAEQIVNLRATSSNSKNSASYTVKNEEGKEFRITFENRGTVDCIATECELIAINVSAENGPRMKLPNGVSTKMSENEVKSKMGRGTIRGVGGSASEYRPKVNFDSYKVNVVFGGDFWNKKVTSIRVEDVIY